MLHVYTLNKGYILLKNCMCIINLIDFSVFQLSVVAMSSANNIQYSEKYYDDIYEYRHVVLPSNIAQLVSKERLMSESEWRQIGVQQSRGWEHYAIHKPEPHIMLFRRPITTPPPNIATRSMKPQVA